jgi:hypothetical protein
LTRYSRYSRDKDKPFTFPVPGLRGGFEAHAHGLRWGEVGVLDVERVCAFQYQVSQRDATGGLAGVFDIKREFLELLRRNGMVPQVKSCVLATTYIEGLSQLMYTMTLTYTPVKPE